MISFNAATSACNGIGGIAATSARTRGPHRRQATALDAGPARERGKGGRAPARKMTLGEVMPGEVSLREVTPRVPQGEVIPGEVAPATIVAAHRGKPALASAITLWQANVDRVALTPTTTDAIAAQGVIMPGPHGCMVICEGCALRYCCRCHLSAVAISWSEGIYGLKHLCAYCALRWREGWTLPIIQAHVRDAILQSLDQQQQQQ